MIDMGAMGGWNSGAGSQIASNLEEKDGNESEKEMEFWELKIVNCCKIKISIHSSVWELPG